MMRIKASKRTLYLIFRTLALKLFTGCYLKDNNNFLFWFPVHTFLMQLWRFFRNKESFRLPQRSGKTRPLLKRCTNFHYFNAFPCFSSSSCLRWKIWLLEMCVCVCVLMIHFLSRLHNDWSPGRHWLQVSDVPLFGECLLLIRHMWSSKNRSEAEKPIYNPDSCCRIPGHLPLSLTLSLYLFFFF